GRRPGQAGLGREDQCRPDPEAEAGGGEGGGGRGREGGQHRRRRPDRRHRRGDQARDPRDSDLMAFDGAPISAEEWAKARREAVQAMPEVLAGKSLPDILMPSQKALLKATATNQLVVSD